MRRLVGPDLGRLKADDGYTLTEMLVVIGIIALIAAVLTPSLIGQLGRARAKTAQMQLDTIAGAVEAYRSDVGAYPPATPGLSALVTEPTGVEGWTGPYLKNAKYLSDPWGNPVKYEHVDNSLTFVVKSLGADGAVTTPGAGGGSGGANRDLQAP